MLKTLYTPPKHKIVVTFICNDRTYYITDCYYPINERKKLKPQLPDLIKSQVPDIDINKLEKIKVVDYQRYPKPKMPKLSKTPLDGQWWMVDLLPISECIEQEGDEWLIRRCVLLRKNGMWVRGWLSNDDLSECYAIRPTEQLLTQRDVRELRAELALAMNTNKKLEKQLNALKGDDIPFLSSPLLAAASYRERSKRQRALEMEPINQLVESKPQGLGIRARIANLFKCKANFT